MVFIFSTQLLAKNSCLKTYTQIYNEESAYGLLVIQNNIEILQNKFQKTLKLNEKEQLESFLKGDIRVVFFKLQGLARVYDKEYDTFFGEYKDYFKKFEDLYGKLDLQNTLLKQALKINEPELVKHYESTKKQAGKDLLAALNESDLLTSHSLAFEKLKSDIKAFKDWKNPKDDKKIHLKRLLSETKKLNKDIKERAYTSDDLELGLHELRRKLRWIVIHVQTLNGLTQYAKEADLPSSTQVYLTELLDKNPRLLESPFLRMRVSDIKHPLVIPQYSHAMLSEIVTRIGNEKDKVETHLYLTQTAQSLNFSAEKMKELENKISSQLTNTQEKVDAKARVEYYQKIIEESQILETYMKSLEELNQ